MGGIWQKKGDDHQALACYDAAVPLLRAHRVPYYMVAPLLGKAETLYNLHQLDAAREHNEEALALAIELSLKDRVLRSQILTAKIEFARGHHDSVCQQLAKLLAETQDHAQQAALCDELRQMGHQETHAQAAITLYRQLYRTKLHFEYKRHLERLLLGQVNAAAAR